MTPGKARVALGTFLLVSAGVTVNALLLQSDAVSAGRAGMGRMSGAPGLAGRGAMLPEAVPPRTSERASRAEQGLRIARFAAEPRSIDPAAAAGEATDAETVRAIQRELKLHGYGPVPVNGTMGFATRAAIMAFEHDHGMALSAEASERLLKRIVLGAAEPADVSQSVADRGASARATEVIRSVQQWLATLGYQPGQIDGRLAEETVKAIRDFEVDKGMVPRGRVSAELVGRLNEAVAAKSSQR
ncbi:MAG TPA: peptidoglycan-binding domain-containing protein [Hyphomicrobiaceae bacterium]|nr:peptidoglycan-binding domain-containing protein [Hyphomicrobiaceae bacterium]